MYGWARGQQCFLVGRWCENDQAQVGREKALGPNWCHFFPLPSCGTIWLETKASTQLQCGTARIPHCQMPLKAQLCRPDPKASHARSTHRWQVADPWSTPMGQKILLDWIQSAMLSSVGTESGGCHFGIVRLKMINYFRACPNLLLLLQWKEYVLGGNKTAWFANSF